MTYLFKKRFSYLARPRRPDCTISFWMDGTPDRQTATTAISRFRYHIQRTVSAISPRFRRQIHILECRSCHDLCLRQVCDICATECILASLCRLCTQGINGGNYRLTAVLITASQYGLSCYSNYNQTLQKYPSGNIFHDLFRIIPDTFYSKSLVFVCLIFCEF